MSDASDMELLREYDREGDDDAFAELVRRHINLVYSAACRHVGNSAHAEEITQAVFIILARKAAGLGGQTVLEGWLYETARLTSLDFLRRERRRQRREQEAYMLSLTQENTDTKTWNKLEPLLDEAMSRLRKKDRDAVVLRFFKEQNLGEVAAALNVTEAAAQSRVHRAVEKLRKILTTRGVILPAADLTAAISANSIQTAPIALTKTVAGVAIAKGMTANGTVLILVKGTAKTMAWLKGTTMAVVLTNAILSQEIIATHFDFAGRPNGWMTRSENLIWSLAAAVGLPLALVAIGYCVRFLPVTKHTFKIPHRDYWLAPERRQETFDYLFHHFLWVACMQAIFMVGIQLLVIQANHRTPAHFSSPLAYGLGGCFLLAMITWLAILFRHFRQVPVGR